MNPSLISKAKAVFHALTVASAALAAFSSFVPAKYAIYAALLSSMISGALHLLTVLVPSAALPDEPSVPVPPARSDPTSVEYNSRAEAIAALIPGYPNVIQKANGKFVIWPSIGPFPGVQVYP